MKLYIPRSVLEDAGQFFEKVGAFGREGTGMVLGTVSSEIANATAFFAPDQVAGEFPNCWVEVTEKGKQQLASGLALGQRYLARIHSHPGEAFHSPIDDRNPAITANGSLSIVVPYFGLGLRRGLQACAIYRRVRQGWTELSDSDVEKYVTVSG